MGLSNKRKVFVEEYLRCWNASEAARRAGYRGRSNTTGQRLLTNVDIRAEIERRLAETMMSTDEVLARLTEQARGEGAQYLTSDGTLDLERLIADKRTHLVKSVRPTKHGLVIEFYDAQSALVQIGKNCGLFKEFLDLTTKGRPIGALVDYSSLSDDELRAILSRRSGGGTGEPDAGAPEPD